MRTAFRTRREEEEEESVFVSMTDMTVGFLFIVIILLAFFASQITPGETVPKQLLDERDDQIAILQQRLLAFNNLVSVSDRDAFELIGEELIALKAEKRALSQKLDEYRKFLDSLKETLGVNSSDKVVHEIAELRVEIHRLHALLREKEADNPIARYNFRAAAELGALLGRVRDQIKSVDEQIDVEVSLKQDALQFRGDGLFGHGQEQPSGPGQSKMQKIAAILNTEIGCFTVGSSQINESCNPNAVVIDAIQIEGHTDSDGSDVFNMALGARRGAAIHNIMVDKHPELLRYRNLQGQSVLSVASYGEGRQIADEQFPGGKDANRRIDLRFLMYTPTSEVSVPLDLEDLSRVGKLLRREGKS